MVQLWWVLIVQAGVAGSMATIGSLNVQWWAQDRGEKAMLYTGLLCWTVAATQVVGAVGLVVPGPGLAQAVFPLRTALMGVVVALLFRTLSATVTVPGVRTAIVVVLAASALLVGFRLTGDRVYTFDEGSPWPRYQPFGVALIVVIQVVAAIWSVPAMRALDGVRRWQFAGAVLIGQALMGFTLILGPGQLSDAMGSLVFLPIAILLAWWCSARVLTLQASLLHAEASWQRAEHSAAFAARHDQLTGLPNQLAATEALQELIVTAGGDQRVLVATVQLNGLDRVRAAAGAQAADNAVKKVAEHLMSWSPAGTLQARLTESTLLFMNQQGAGPTLTLWESKAASVAQSFRRIADLPPELTIVFGIAVATETSTAPELLQQARIALTAANQGGRVFQLYRPELREDIVGRARTARLLTAATDRDEFELYYQPVFDTISGQRTSVEALVRWRHHGRLHPPADWIPIAEQYHLMSQIGLKVLSIAVRDHAALGCPIAVNVSPQQFHEPDFVANMLAAMGSCPPAAVILEITESSLMGDPVRAAEALERLRRHGIRIALDDFGTQYSSLSRLATMPFDIVKIDRSFVSRIMTADGRAMVTAIHSMARALGKVTVAEGVETNDVRQRVRDIGCDFIQGYLTGRPVPLSDLMTDPLASPWPSVVADPGRLVSTAPDGHSGGVSNRDPGEPA